MADNEELMPPRPLSTFSFNEFLFKWKNTLLMSTNSTQQDAQFPSYFYPELRQSPQLLYPRKVGGGTTQDLPHHPLHANINDTTTNIVTTAIPLTVQLGTGAHLFTTHVLPAMLTAQYEILFVTCFWAPSMTLTAVSRTIAALARQRIADGANVSHSSPTTPPRLRIRIGFSSRSFMQRLLHTRSRRGYIYPPDQWDKVLGLPPRELLDQAGIDMQVKSLFFNPLSVLHSKFVVVDGREAWMMSANVSWEPWLEGVVAFEGPAVARLRRFWEEVWGDGPGALSEPPRTPSSPLPPIQALEVNNRPDTEHQKIKGPASATVLEQQQPLIWDTQMQAKRTTYAAAGLPVVLNGKTAAVIDGAMTSLQLECHKVPTILLPSSHHVNPRFRLFPWVASVPPPQTPLNAAILELLSTAQYNIYIQSPNLTCMPVIDELIAALSRGVDVRIVLGGRKMMVLEQLVTAGTTTQWCVNKLIRRYSRLQLLRIPRDSSGDGQNVSAAHRNQPTTRSRLEVLKAILGLGGQSTVDHGHVEEGLPVPGSLQVEFFAPAVTSSTAGDGLAGGVLAEENPTHAHIKLTIVDGCMTVLGSGNMDRASFYTSQELGILFYSGELSNQVKDAANVSLCGNVERYFPT